jgi:hypothetical protein
MHPQQGCFRDGRFTGDEKLAGPKDRAAIRGGGSLLWGSSLWKQTEGLGGMTGPEGCLVWFYTFLKEKKKSFHCFFLMTKVFVTDNLDGTGSQMKETLAASNPPT